jgi:hypothetical protein
MKPERIEELARLAYEAAAGAHRQAWDRLSDVWKDDFRMIARTLYAAAMRNAAGVARERQEFFLRRSNEREGPAEVFELARGNAAQTIATALETIAKETDSDNG